MKQKKKITVTQAQINKLQYEAMNEATDKAMLIFLAALKDEFNFDEDKLVRVLERADRYADYIDRHLVTIRQTQELIEKKTGLQFKGF